LKIKLSVLLYLFISVTFVFAAKILAQEPFLLQNVEYQSYDSAAKLEIETNRHVECVIYELEDPHRIVIDPLDTVWCDFEEKVYFEEGVVKSIKFIKGRETPDGPGSPYYPFDFVTVELRSPYPYKLQENDYILTLNIGKDKIPEEEHIPIDMDQAKMIEEAFADEMIVEIELRKETEALSELTEDRMEIDITKDELNKKEKALNREEADLAKEKEILKEDKAKLDKDKEDLKKEIKSLARKRNEIKLPVRPVTDILKGEIPRDYLNKRLALDDCIKIALVNSISIKATKERFKLARMKVNEAFRELFPELTFILDETKGKVSERWYLGRKMGFELKQVVFHGGEQMYLWKQAKANLNVAEENLNKVKEDIIFEVTKAYYELARAENKHNFQQELLEDINADFDIAKKEFEFNLVSEIDFMNIESSISQTYHTLLTTQNSLSLAQLGLNKVMNIDMDAEVEIDSKLEYKELNINLNNCIELALKYRPDYRIRVLNREVAHFTEKLAQSQTFPQIDIFGKFMMAKELLEPTHESLDNRLDSENVMGATVSLPLGPHTLDYQKKRVKLAPTVSTFESNTFYDTSKYRLGIFDNMGRYTEMTNASAGYKDSLEELNKAEQEMQTEVREAIYSLSESKLKIRNVLNNITLYNKELEVARAKKGLGEITFYDLIQSKVKLYTEMSLYKETLGDYYTSVARINKAIGLGGYFN